MKSRPFASLALLMMLAASPSTKQSINEVQLDSPLDSDSKTFLDLDTVKTFTFANYHRENFVRQSGVDIMCETREPVNGFSTYGLALVTTNASFDRPPPFNQMVESMAKLELIQFEMHSPKSYPAVYLFRTKAGAYGILEIAKRADGLAGLSLRYQILERPRPVAEPNVRRELPMIVVVQQLQRQGFLASKFVPPNHPALRNFDQQLAILNALVTFEAACAGVDAMGVDCRQVALLAKTQRSKQFAITSTVLRSLMEIDRPRREALATKVLAERVEQAVITARSTLPANHPNLLRLQNDSLMLNRLLTYRAACAGAQSVGLQCPALAKLLQLLAKDRALAATTSWRNLQSALQGKRQLELSKARKATTKAF